MLEEKKNGGWWKYWERIKDRKLWVVFVFIQHSNTPLLHYSE
jgi:hypothetical protein